MFRVNFLLAHLRKIMYNLFSQTILSTGYKSSPSAESNDKVLRLIVSRHVLRAFKFLKCVNLMSANCIFCNCKLLVCRERI